jgi:endogenous inhibitor of DNA gyrase (YacG/DUF329 family)
MTRYQAARNQTCSAACKAVLIGAKAKGRPAHNKTRATVACSVCGKPKEIPLAWLKRVKNPTCSRQCNGVLRGQEWAKHAYKASAARTPESYAKAAMRGAKNPAWKGGVTLKRPKGNYKGVRYVRAPEWAKPMARKDGYIMEHRLVMAQMCGFLLTRTEVVNHIDHNPSNNHPGNLELWPTNADHKRGEVGRFVTGVANRSSPRVLAAP